MKFCLPALPALPALLLAAAPALAWETDQYTLPEEPLIDVGPQVSGFVYRNLQAALDEVNAGLASYPGELARLRGRYGDGSSTRTRTQAIAAHGRFGDRRRQASPWLKLRRMAWLETQLAAYETEQGVAQSVADAIGRSAAFEEKVDGIFGFPTAFAPQGVARVDGRRTYFSPEKYETIYTLAGFHRGMHAAFWVLSSTINVHGTEIGIDKLGHIFNEGHHYYELYQDALAQGRSPQDARQAAVDWGIWTENGIFGLLVSGVYSNGDLAANLAGLYFYRNLFHPVTLDGQHYPPMVERHAGRYRIAVAYAGQPQKLFHRFVSDGLNEALNPSRLEGLQVQPVVRALRSRCADWRARYPERPWSWYVDKQQALSRWNGLDYGYKGGNTVNIGEVCAAPASPRRHRPHVPR